MLRGLIGIGGTALDVDRLHLRADIGGYRLGDAHEAVRLFAHGAAGNRGLEFAGLSGDMAREALKRFNVTTTNVKVAGVNRNGARLDQIEAAISRRAIES